MQALRQVTKKLNLAVNEEKTRICRVPEGSFDFLGYTFGRCHSRKDGRAYLGTKPSRKSIKRLCDAIRAETGRHTLTGSAEQLVKLLNRKLQGWANYFRLGPVTPAYWIVDRRANYRLRQWLRRKHQVESKGIKQFSNRFLYDALGLIRLNRLTRDLPWAKA